MKRPRMNNARHRIDNILSLLTLDEVEKDKVQLLVGSSSRDSRVEKMVGVGL